MDNAQHLTPEQYQKGLVKFHGKVSTDMDFCDQIFKMYLNKGDAEANMNLTLEEIETIMTSLSFNLIRYRKMMIASAYEREHSKIMSLMERFDSLCDLLQENQKSK